MSLNKKLFIAEEIRENKIKETNKWKIKVEDIEQEKRCLEKQLKDSRKQNRLLKIAISKIQNDFEKVLNQIQHPIDLNYSLHEDNSNNLLLKLEKVMEENIDVNMNNDQILQKLEEANNKVGNLTQTKLLDYPAYNDESEFNRKFKISKPRINSQSFTSYKSISNMNNSCQHRNFEHSPVKFKNRRNSKQDISVVSWQNISFIRKTNKKIN